MHLNDINLNLLAVFRKNQREASVRRPVRPCDSTDSARYNRVRDGRGATNQRGLPYNGTLSFLVAPRSGGARRETES